MLLAEAGRLMVTTRQRIDRTVALLGKPTVSTVQASTVQASTVHSRTSSAPSVGRIEPLEQREHQLRPVGLELGMDAELQARR
ncbi:MAG: hypothetical protein RL685_3240 [Pseudomonadota bacterium]|jgi:hypothetical protein